MSLPQSFSEFNHLKDLVKKEHNKVVQAWFRKQKDDDLSTAKGGLKHACLIKDNDSALTIQMRLWLFEVTVGRMQAIQRPVYAIPEQEVQTNWKYKPQVTLYFLEPYNSEAHGQGESKAEAEISFRLVAETSESMTRAKAEKLAREIKNEFAKPVFEWGKGWYKCTYLDAERGYDLRLFVKSKVEGERVVRQVLKIQNHPFERDNFQFIEHDRSYPANPGTHRVYGQTRKKYTKRPRVDVKFKYAQLKIQGLPNAINLVATGGTRLRSVIEQV